LFCIDRAVCSDNISVFPADLLPAGV